VGVGETEGVVFDGDGARFAVYVEEGFGERGGCVEGEIG
jgi:hypothetical protein